MEHRCVTLKRGRRHGVAATEQKPRTRCERAKERRLDAGSWWNQPPNGCRFDTALTANVKVHSFPPRNGPCTLRQMEVNPVPDAGTADVLPSG